MKKKFFIFLSFLVLFFSFSLKIQAVEEVGDLYAVSAVLMDGESGRILYEKNGQEFLANASTTKILTCIIALEEGNLTDSVNISEYAASMPDVQLNVQQGETYRLGDLLYSLMLESHNDVAVAVAEHLAGSCENFSKKMNEKAKEIGCNNTFFLTPNGLDASQGEKSHGTTAEDLACLMRYCIGQSPQKEKFLEITGTFEYSFSALKGERTFTCYNRNAFLTMMEGAFSGKTGFTSKAGYCYVGALKREGRTYIVALLGCGWPGNKHYKWQDCRKLMEYGILNYKRYLLSDIEIGQKDLLKVKIPGGKNEEQNYFSLQELEMEGIEQQGILLKEGEKISVKIRKEPKSAPLDKGEIMGSISYYIDEDLWLTRNLFLRQKVELIDYKWCLQVLVKKIFS